MRAMAKGGKSPLEEVSPHYARRSAPQRRDHLSTRNVRKTTFDPVPLHREEKRGRKWAGDGGFAYPIGHGALPGLQTRRSKSVAGMKQAASATSMMRSVAREEIMQSYSRRERFATGNWGRRRHSPND